MEDKYTIAEFANEAIKKKIDLGANPIRTIRYYVSIGLLKKPQINQVGKKRVSYFDKERLLILEIISSYKKKGLTLKEIKEKLEEKFYWSDEALNFIEKYRNEIPNDVFIKNKYATRAEVAFYLSKLLDNVKDYNEYHEKFKNALVDKNGNPVDDYDLGVSRFGSEEDYP